MSLYVDLIFLDNDRVVVRTEDPQNAERSIGPDLHQLVKKGQGQLDFITTPQTFLRGIFSFTFYGSFHFVFTVFGFYITYPSIEYKHIWRRKSLYFCTEKYKKDESCLIFFLTYKIYFYIRDFIQGLSFCLCPSDRSLVLWVH